jgi:hypothetical protein
MLPAAAAIKIVESPNAVRRKNFMRWIQDSIAVTQARGTAKH